MLDVHPPHQSPHGWRDFLLHLVTITIGLLIALSLEGCVEWQHHRHLVHQAEDALQAEIRENAKGMQKDLDGLHKQQETLKHDVEVMKFLILNHKMPPNAPVDVSFNIHTFNGVSWKTAQSTGALSYMPYDRTQEYADIYLTQDSLMMAEQQAARDAIVSLGPFLNLLPDDPGPAPEDARPMRDKLEVLQGQLLLVDSLMKSLDQSYKKFLANHPL